MNTLRTFHANRRLHHIFFTFALLSLTLFSYRQAQAQATPWSPQQRIPGYLDRTEPPILIADSMGVVHAFAYQRMGDGEEGEVAIIYSVWTAKDGWTLPTDIMLSPLKRQARVMDVYLDKQDVFHLIFYGGDETEAYLFYSSAHLSQAYRATGWSSPVVIGEWPLTPSLARLTGNEEGDLFALYSGNLDGPGLFLVTSTDGGETWDSPEPFFLTYNRFHRPAVIDWRWGESGTLHLVWQISDDQGHNIAGYYAQSSSPAVLSSWSPPRLIDEGIAVESGMGVANPTVIEYNGYIIIAYNNGIPPDGVPPTNWMRISADGGQTWTDRLRISQNHVGRNGLLSFVTDSSEELHLFYGLRIPVDGDSAIHGMWHTIWQDGQWSRSEPVASGRGGTGFDPYDAKAVVALGNQVLVTWRTDPGNSRPGVWYAAAQLNSPALEPVPIHSVEEGNELGEGTAVLPPVPSPADPAPPFAAHQDTLPTSRSIPLYQSVAPSLLFVVLITFIAYWRRSQRTRL